MIENGGDADQPGCEPQPKGRTPPYLAALLQQLQCGDPVERAAAVTGLCVAFEPLVKSLARQYWRPLGPPPCSASVPGGELVDLEQVARLGLLEACTTFDATKGAFPSHATWCIRSALAKYLGRLENPVHLPTHMSFRLPKLHRIAERLAQTLQREPTIAELSGAMKLSEAAVTTMLTYEEGPLSLDAQRGHDDGGSSVQAWVETYPSPGLTPEEALVAKEEAEERQKKGVRLWNLLTAPTAIATRKRKST